MTHSGAAVTASYSWIPGSELAVIDMSSASGLWRIPETERNPSRASTFGTGELMADAIAHGARNLIIGLGGSATNDAGVGMAAALGWKFLDDQNQPVDSLPCGVPSHTSHYPARYAALLQCDGSLRRQKPSPRRARCDARLRSAKRRDARNADRSGGIPESSRASVP